MDSGALGMNWCAPCQYVKLRNGIYLFNLVEEACNGAETCVVINTRIMHDCGFGFEGNQQGVNLGKVGAIARNIGSYDVKRFFGPRKAGGPGEGKPAQETGDDTWTGA